VRLAKKILMIARAKERVKKLETIIGKMVIDTPLGPDIGMLSDDEIKIVDEIADKYLANSSTGSEPAVLDKGRLYHFNPGLAEEVGQRQKSLKEKTRQKSTEEDE